MHKERKILKMHAACFYLTKSNRNYVNGFFAYSNLHVLSFSKIYSSKQALVYRPSKLISCVWKLKINYNHIFIRKIMIRETHMLGTSGELERNNRANAPRRTIRDRDTTSLSKTLRHYINGLPLL
jgi:hypothetical protein